MPQMAKQQTGSEKFWKTHKKLFERAIIPMKFLKQLSLYTFVGFIGAGINFFLLPYLSHFIRPGEYGILAMITSFVTIIVPLISLVAFGLINVEFFKIRDKTEFASLFSSILIIPVIPTIIFLVLTCLIPGKLATLFEIPGNKEYWIPIAVLIAFFSINMEILLGLAITQQKSLHYAFFFIGKTLIDVGLTVLFVTSMRLNWEGRLMSLGITNIIFFIVSLFYFRKQKLITRNVQWKYVRAGIFFGLPLILHTIGKFVINQSDRIFIAKMVSLDEAGIYNIGYQVGMAQMLLVNAAGNFFGPFLYERLSNLTKNSEREIVKYSYIIMALLFLFLLVLTFASPYFFSWLIDKDYSKGAAYVFWIGLSYFFWGVYIIFSSFIFYKAKTNFLGYLAIFNVVVNIALNYLLIPKFGGLGAAYATCISFFFIAIIVIWRSVRLYKLPWFSFYKM